MTRITRGNKVKVFNKKLNEIESTVKRFDWSGWGRGVSNFEARFSDWLVCGWTLWHFGMESERSRELQRSDSCWFEDSWKGTMLVDRRAVIPPFNVERWLNLPALSLCRKRNRTWRPYRCRGRLEVHLASQKCTLDTCRLLLGVFGAESCWREYRECHENYFHPPITKKPQNKLFRARNFRRKLNESRAAIVENFAGLSSHFLRSPLHRFEWNF
jgi:hypothetical protein